jgi:hypothetical protein
MKLLGVRYILVHSDFVGYPAEQFMELLSKQSNITPALNSGFIQGFQTGTQPLASALYVLPQMGSNLSGIPIFQGREFLVVDNSSSAPKSPLSFSAGQDFAIAAWVRTTSQARMAVAQNNVFGGTYAGWILGLEGGRPFFQAGQSTVEPQVITANVAINDGALHFLVGQRGGTTWRIHVDGKPVAAVPDMPSTSLQNNQNTSIGARITTYGGNTWFFDGSIASVQMYKSALPDGDVKRLYEEGLSGSLQSNGNLVLQTLVPTGDNFSKIDTSPSRFKINIFGDMQVWRTVLPIEVNWNAWRNATLLAVSEAGLTSWRANVLSYGHFVLVLARPFSPGWEARFGDMTVVGRPLFDGAAIGFPIDQIGELTINLYFVLQDTLVYATLATSISFPVMVAVVPLTPPKRGLEFWRNVFRKRTER